MIWRYNRGSAQKGGIMKKIICTIIMLFLFSSVSVYPLGVSLLDIRNGIFTESNELKLLLANSQDPGVIVTMWSSCIITVNQLNAYFYILGIFDALKTETLSEDPTIYLISWLTEMKRTNEANIKSLESVPSSIEQRTRSHLQKLKNYFSELNSRIDTELKNISTVRQTLKIKRPR
jgi:hypothetical protein